MESRRRLLAYMALASGLPALVGCAAQTRSPHILGDITDNDPGDQWMRTWIAEAKATSSAGNEAPSGPLYIGRFADPVYFITQQIGWDPNPGQLGFSPVRVPVGFVTDFASIPRVFWSSLRPDGLYAYAAIIHDYLYWEQTLSREQSDAAFKACMEDFKISAATVWAVHIGVRLGGKAAWKENARKKAAGEKRVLKNFPTDPTVRWDEWRGRSDVFV